MLPKRTGCCSKCDVECFEVISRDPETRIPKQLGGPLDNAVRCNFIMYDGSTIDLTLCTDCYQTFTPADFMTLWHRVLLSWGDHPWVKTQTENGLVGIRSALRWKDVPL